MGIGAAATPRVETLGGGASLPLSLYIVEAKGQPTHEVLPLLAQPYFSPSSSLVVLGEALPRSPLLPPPRRRAAGSASTSPSPLLDQEGGDIFPNRTCVERGGVVRSALGHR